MGSPLRMSTRRMRGCGCCDYAGDEAGAYRDADESDDVDYGYSRGGEVCHAKGVELSVDNTFLSPYLQQPIELGADIVMHSTTKFLNGHSDGLGGVLVCTKPEHAETFRFVQKCTGGILSPFESYLLLRGVKTLAVRMKQHDANGRVVADFLAGKRVRRRCFIRGWRSIRSMSWRSGSSAGLGR